jgi:hypothetical protein
MRMSLERREESWKKILCKKNMIGTVLMDDGKDTVCLANSLMLQD